MQDWPARAVHSILLHTGDVVFWGYGGDFGDPTNNYLWNSVTEEVETLPQVPVELFCAGHSSLADGRIMAVGGTSPLGLGEGPVTNAIYDPLTKSWTQVADLFYGRYYPTATTLPDGSVAAVSGRIQEVPVVENAEYPEIYDVASDTWTVLEDAW